MLNTLHLQTFIAVVEAGSYSAAAERLHMSQPAVSQHIRTLELQFENVRLFRRVGQQMKLTHEGEQLVDVAREMLALAARAEENIRGLRGQISGRVTLGCTPSSGEVLLPPLLAQFRERYPAIIVTVMLAPLETLLEWLAGGQAHVLLVEEAQRRRGWESQPVGGERLALIAPRGHQLLQPEPVPAAALRGVPLVLPRSGTAQRRVIDEGLRRRGVSAAEIHVALETDGAALMVQAVRSGLGLAFVPQSRVPRGRELGIVEVAGVNLQQDWYLLRSRERGAPLAVSELYSFVVGRDARRVTEKAGIRPPPES